MVFAFIPLSPVVIHIHGRRKHMIGQLINYLVRSHQKKFESTLETSVT